MSKKRFKIEKGDIFKVSFQNKKVRFFQFMEENERNIHTDIVRVFNLETIDSKPETLLEKLRESFTIDFFAHTLIKEGCKEGFWEKIGNIKIEGYTRPTFLYCEDNIHKTSKSYNWWLKHKDRNEKIGELKEQYKGLPHSRIHSPESFYHWLETGDSGDRYPD